MRRKFRVHARTQAPKAVRMVGRQLKLFGALVMHRFNNLPLRNAQPRDFHGHLPCFVAAGNGQQGQPMVCALGIAPAGAWGQLDPDDIWATEHAVKPGVRLLSAYHLADSTTIWSITEVNWSSTCVLLPDHY